MPRSRFLANDAVYTSSGKAATYWALADAGVGPGDDVVVPSYHCPTMIFPVLARGANPVFVPIQADTSIDPYVIREVVTPRTKALLLPHFFGFLQPRVESIQAWCRSHRIALVEDCAHAFYGGVEGPLAGNWGDYAIASTRKFFPGCEGGALVANGHRFSQLLEECSWVDELRGAYLVFEESLRYGALRLQRGSTAREPALIGPSTEEESRAEAEAAPASDEDLRLAASGRRALRGTVWLIRHAEHARIAAVRRRRYEQWRDVVGRLSGVEPFHRDCPASQVPYVYPVRLLRPERQFRALKYAGVAVWRWDQLAESNCAVSARLALELVQMPCQHSMGDDDFDRLLAAFSRVVESA